MKRSFMTVVVASMIFGGAFCSRLLALDLVTWEGGDGRWEEANWTKNGIPGQTAAAAMGDNTGGRGGMNISIGGGAMVEFDPNNGEALFSAITTRMVR